MVNGVTMTKTEATPSTAQRISVLYFARIAELTGLREEHLTLSLPTTGTALLEMLRTRHPALAQVKNLRLAVNQTHAPASIAIQGDDEVALFEPVTGG